MMRIIHVATTIQCQFALLDEHDNVVELRQSDPFIVRDMLGNDDPLREFLSEFRRTVQQMRGQEDEG